MYAALLQTAAAGALQIPFEQYQLDNGLQVVLHRDPTLPQVVVNLWYGVGSKDEEPGRSGFAHLFEHLMFMGTNRVPSGGFDQIMEASGGWNNAWTSEDATDYYEVGPSNLLPTLLWLEADRLDSLGRAMTQEKLDLQRDVVRNERRQSYEDEPYGQAWLTLSAVMYPEGHPYHEPVIGSHEDLAAATVADVQRFFSTWYVPNNASLVVAGDFDPAQVRALIQQYFGGIPASPLPAREAPPQPDRPVVALTELTDGVQLPQTLLAWNTAPSMAPGDAEMDLLASILTTGRTSRLYQRLIHDEGSAQEVSAMQMSQSLGSLFLILAKPAEGHTLEALEAAITAELARLATEGPTPAELDRARNQYEMSFLRKMEALQARASALNRYLRAFGQPDGLERDLGRYRDATVDGVRQAAASLTPERRAIVRVRPETR